MEIDKLIDTLKSPELVVKVQEYFGIKYITKPHSSKNLPTKEKRNVNCNNESQHNDGSIKSENEFPKSYLILNKFWYWLFIIGTELGDELFYATFIPFWFWNVDGAVGRRVIFLWSIVMYIGQALKDIIRMPRPGKPVMKLQSKWSAEYGMPSTHAMVAISIPFSVLIFTQAR